MKTKKFPLILAFAAAVILQAMGLRALAQDLTIDLQTDGPRTVGDVAVDSTHYTYLS